jgi:hypothetical protein
MLTRGRTGHRVLRNPDAIEIFTGVLITAIPGMCNPLLGELPRVDVDSCPREALRPNGRTIWRSGSDQHRGKSREPRSPNHLRHVPRLSFKRSSVKL